MWSLIQTVHVYLHSSCTYGEGFVPLALSLTHSQLCFYCPHSAFSYWHFKQIFSKETSSLCDLALILLLSVSTNLYFFFYSLPYCWYSSKPFTNVSVAKPPSEENLCIPKAYFFRQRYIEIIKGVKIANYFIFALCRCVNDLNGIIWPKLPAQELAQGNTSSPKGATQLPLTFIFILDETLSWFIQPLPQTSPFSKETTCVKYSSSKRWNACLKAYSSERVNTFHLRANTLSICHSFRAQKSHSNVGAQRERVVSRQRGEARAGLGARGASCLWARVKLKAPRKFWFCLQINLGSQ